MKKLIIFLFVLCLFHTTARGQGQSDYCVLRISNLPGTYTWDNKTDYNETGKWTETSGSKNDTNTFKDSTFFSNVSYVGNSFNFDHSDYFYFLTIDVGGPLTRFRKVSFSLTVPPDRTYSFSIDSINAIETSSTFEFLLSGKQILGHNLILNNIHRIEGGYSFQFVDTFTYSGTVTDSSVIFFSISKPSMISLSIPEGRAQELFALYPIPASNKLDIQLPEGFKNDLSVFDILGRKIMHVIVEQNITRTQLNVSSLPPGIYFLRAGNQMQKFVIQR